MIKVTGGLPLASCKGFYADLNGFSNKASTSYRQCACCVGLWAQDFTFLTLRMDLTWAVLDA